MVYDTNKTIYKKNHCLLTLSNKIQTIIFYIRWLKGPYKRLKDISIQIKTSRLKRYKRLSYYLKQVNIYARLIYTK